MQALRKLEVRDSFKHSFKTLRYRALKASTVDRILGVAEIEFSQCGFVETSLRVITSKAKVNLAAVNYHFGSKKGLIQAVADRFLEPFCERINPQLLAFEEHDFPDEQALAELLGIFVNALYETANGQASQLALFARLVNFSYSQSQGHLRKHLTRRYRSTLTTMLKLMGWHLQVQDHEECFWRFHNMLGVLVFTFSHYEAMLAIAESEYQSNKSLQNLMTDLVPVLLATFQTPQVTATIK